MDAPTTGYGSKAPVPSHVPPELVVDFDFYNMDGVEDDFHRAWKRLQDAHPDKVLIWTPRNEGHWIPLHGEDVHHIFGDYQNFTSKCLIIPKSAGEDFSVLPTMLDPPEHGPVRALVNPHLSPKAIFRLESDIRNLAVALIEGFRGRGQCEFIHEYSEILPIQIFMTMVNLPMEDAPMLKFWANEINLPSGAMTMEEVMSSFENYLAPYILARRENPGDDMMSQLLQSKRNGELISLHDANELLTQILLGGLDTVAFTLGFFILFLAQNSGHRRQLVADHGLIPGAVDEMLRRFPIATNSRMVAVDQDYKGIKLKAGEMIALPTTLHNLDEREYEDAFNVDFRRKVERISTFGAGAHRCPGMFLARTEIRITLEEWLTRIPEFELEPGFRPVMRGGMVGAIEKIPLRWPTA